MPYVCAVAECRNRNGPDLAFHRFPSHDKVRCKKWEVKCKRLDKLNVANARVCAAHFTDEDYERDLQNELLGLPLRKKLKPTAIPSIFMERFPGTSSKRETRQKNRISRKLVNEILENTTLETDIDMVDDCSGKCEASTQTDSKPKPTQEMRKLKKEIKDLKETIKNLRHRLKIANKSSKRKGKKSESEKLFSSSQLKKIGGQKRVNWETPDIAKALSLRSINLKAYETARLGYKLPLPAPRTLRTWVHRFSCAPGLLRDVVEILRDYASTLDELSKLCTLSYDEMTIDSRYILDPVNGKIVSHSKVQVLMARGIYQNWKQPLYYNFDTPMTTKILEEIIVSLESAGFPVVSVTSDLGGENRSIWKQYGIGTDKSWFENPYDKTRKVHVLADVPHMLKLIRNHLLDDGFLTEDNNKDNKDNNIINKETFETLVNATAGELTLCPKLKHKLLEVTGAERMRVRPAAQLFSHHSATLAKRVFPDQPQISKFIQAVNDGFDVLNSRVPVDGKNPLAGGFGLEMDMQIEALSKLKDFMENGRFFMKSNRNSGRKRTSENEVKEAASHVKSLNRKKNCLLPCQIGFIVSINSLVNLYKDLHARYGLKNNPTPTEFRYRFRLVLLGGQVRAPQGTNVLSHCVSSYISAELLERNKISCTVEKAKTTTDIPFKFTRKKTKVATQTQEALEYLAGYLAWKLKRKFPRMETFGTPTSKITDSEVPCWIQSLSRGGLLSPNSYISDVVKKCNAVFEASITALQNVNNIHDELLQKIISEFPGMQIDIVKEFVKVRIKIRIKTLNIGRTDSRADPSLLSAGRLFQILGRYVDKN